jgi:hypothetical protein
MGFLNSFHLLSALFRPCAVAFSRAQNRVIDDESNLSSRDGMAAESKAKLWEIGVPLSEAWLEFAPADARAQFENAPGFWDTLNESLKAPENQTASRALSSAVEAISGVQKRNSLQAELQENLLEDLFNSELVAIAYRVRPTGSRGPVQIPKDVFFDAVGFWSEDAVEALEFRYVRVRVLNPYSAPAKAVPKKKIGRPGSKEPVIAAIRFLNQNPEFKALPRKVALGKVYSRLIELGFEFDRDNPPKGAGLSATNIEKLIVNICGEKKITRRKE